MFANFKFFLYNKTDSKIGVHYEENCFNRVFNFRAGIGMG